LQHDTLTGLQKHDVQGSCPWENRPCVARNAIRRIRRPAAKVRRRRPEDIDDDDEDDDEEYERRPRRRSVRRQDSGDEVVSTIIPYKNPRALAGYYCGIFSLFPILGFILGPAALILGIMGLRYVRENPDAHGTAHAIIAVIGGVLGTLISLIVGIAVIVALTHK
jgi:hypothetical protein